MSRRSVRLLALAASGLGVLAILTPAARAQHAGHGAAAPGAVAPTAPAPRKYTMEELHASGGVPRGWKFALPAGDPAKGRQVFADLECYKCHAVKGAGFPPTGGDAKDVGPALTGMGSHHPAEYFAESVLAPNAVIVDGPGFIGPDGRSIMPSYADSLSVTQLVDLVAYLKSLTGDEGPMHMEGAAAMEQAAGDYVVWLVYAAGGGHGDHAGHTHGGAAGSGHLMVFVSDRTTGEPVPYLPVTATLRGGGMQPRTLKLAPMADARGFHYGVNVTVPDETEKVVVAIGRTTMRAMPSAKGRFAKPVTVEFEWVGP
jgi:mono/diheme cytochrome c family protein